MLVNISPGDIKWLTGFLFFAKKEVITLPHICFLLFRMFDFSKSFS